MVICLCMCRGHRAIQRLKTPDRVDWRLINMISSCLLEICENVQSKLETKFTNEIWVSDGLRVIEGAVNAPWKSVWMTTVMLHSCIHQTTSLLIQIWCTWSTFWTLLMVGHGNWGEGTGEGKVRKLGYINEKLVYGSTCGKLPAESTGMWQRYVIHCLENMCISWSGIETPECFWMQLSIHPHYTLAVNNDYMIICTKLLPIQQQLEYVFGEHQWSVNDFWSRR